MPLERTLRHLDALYARTDDPWQHRTSPYEAAKYRETLRRIGPGPFQEALEIGCGNGTLLARLAPRCHRLTGIDCIPAAAQAAAAATAHLPHVTVRQGEVPRDLPATSPDLVLLSEVLYFLTPEEIAALAAWLRPKGARIVCVNWAGRTDEPLDAAAAMRIFRAALGRPGIGHLHDGFRIDLFPA
ncbi:SAM-dependent methyltransferase [Falsirhodobacter algicola]|uniref:Methyltransferase domain-containing protein n=1 Tax=Falsirhodobacter algicola TaxID=2692330 RepID=A0A8J8MSX6_9RHOB|nr:SAM-dependent methyltransferase [Falsirhodobacter algicola]QUS36135.1 methyltransferase domain-containing protein [Falsirhodobacter algicola]